MIAHITIVMLHYIFLDVEQRNCTDVKTFGGVFQVMIEEMKDIAIFEALLRILEIAIDKIRTMEHISKIFTEKNICCFYGHYFRKIST